MYKQKALKKIFFFDPVLKKVIKNSFGDNWGHFTVDWIFRGTCICTCVHTCMRHTLKSGKMWSNETRQWVFYYSLDFLQALDFLGYKSRRKTIWRAGVTEIYKTVMFYFTSTVCAVKREGMAIPAVGTVEMVRMVRVILEYQRLLIDDGMTFLADIFSKASGFLTIMTGAT